MPCVTCTKSSVSCRETGGCERKRPAITVLLSVSKSGRSGERCVACVDQTGSRPGRKLADLIDRMRGDDETPISIQIDVIELGGTDQAIVCSGGFAAGTGTDGEFMP